MAISPEARSDPERWAEWIAARGLATPAVLFLELHRPLAHLASQFMIIGTPLLAPLLGLERFEGLRELLADDAQYERLLALIEEKARATGVQEQA